MWQPANDTELKSGVAVWNFDGKVEHGLPLTIGDSVHILEENMGWYHGYCTKNTSAKGIFPVNVVHVREAPLDGEEARRRKANEPLIQEVTLVLREWHVIFQERFMTHKMDWFRELKKIMLEVIELRRQLLSGTMTLGNSKEVKCTIMNRVDWGNCRLGLDLVPSVDGEMVDSSQCSLVELHKVHMRSAEETGSSSLPVQTSVQPLLSLISLQVPAETGAQQQISEPLEAFAHHLHLQLVNFGINTIEPAEAFFALYDAREGVFITERYLAKFNKQGAPLNVEKIGNLVTIFTDLSNKDLERDLYLTCNIVRCGQMQAGKSTDKKQLGPTYRRPYGYGVLKISHILTMPDDDGRGGKEEVMKIYSLNNQDIEKDFATLHEQLIKNTGRRGGSTAANIGITVKLLLLHGHLEDLRKDKHLLFNRGPNITRKLGFSDIIMPGDLRNDLFISLERAEFTDRAKNFRNIEVTICVIDDRGKKLSCICMVEDESPQEEYRSVVYYHNMSPRWNEIVRLNVPMDVFKDTHIRFEFRHCSNKDQKKRDKRLFAIAFLPLMKKDGTAVQDGTHSLFVYKCSEHHDVGGAADQYLKFPYCQRDVSSKGNILATDIFEHSIRDLFEVRTIICSTKLTQNIDLLGLLKWRVNPNKLHAILEKLTRVSGQDIVRVLQDILDALFSILDERTSEYGRQIFESLVHIISVLGEQRFKSFTTVLDTYIDRHFVSTLAHKFLVDFMMSFIQNAGSYKQEHVTNMLEGLQYLFKFIFRSHILYKMATGDIHDGDIQDSIRNLFQSINSLIQKDEDALEKHQLVVLRKFSTICNELMAMAMYTAPEVSQFTADLLDCIPLNLRRQSVIKCKLECIKEAINSSLFKSKMARRVLLQPCLTHLQHHIKHELLLPYCISIVEDILLMLNMLSQTEQVDEEITIVVKLLFKEITAVVRQLSREILSLVPTDKKSELHTRCVTCLMEMLRLMEEKHYSQLISDFSDSNEKYDFMRGILSLFVECVTKDIYPKDWAAMRMVVNRVLQSAIKKFCSDLNHEDMIKLRTQYFELAVFFIIQPALQLETFTQAKQERLKEKFGDMRIEMAEELIEKWDSLGAAKVHYCGLIRPFLEITMIPHDMIRMSSLPLIFDIMCFEVQERGTIMKLEDELIDKLDDMVCVQKKGDERYTEMFKHVLSEKIATQPWKEEGKQFVEKVTQLLVRLIDYRNVSNESVENRYLQLSCIYQLMNFYKDDERRKEIYMKYIYLLHDLHSKASDFTEAAKTLMMLAKTLEWTDNFLPSDRKHVAETERERKERLYGEIIELVKKGQVWEYGIPLCKELAYQYEYKLFDYKNLSVQLVTQAQFFENIRNQPRQQPSFFRVRFFGNFPILRKNREYIYRGHPFDQPAVVIQRFQSDFPRAKAWSNKHPPTEADLASSEQYIEVRHVIPVPQEKQEAKAMPANIRYFSEYYDISVFSFDRPFHRGERDKQKEFKTLWVERTIMTTATSLPGLLSWSEIVNSEMIEIRPIENAINTMKNKNSSMKEIIDGYSAKRNSNINPLSMVLQGTIEAAVQGGMKVFQETFMTLEYEETNPGDKDAIATLQQLMIHQLTILDNGVLLHKELCSENLKQFQQNLEKKLAELMTEFGLGPPKVYARILKQHKLPPAGASSSNITSAVKTFRRVPSEANVQQPVNKDRATSKFYVQTSADSTPSRGRSQSVFTVETIAQRQPTRRKDSLPTLLSPTSPVDTFTCDIRDSTTSSSSNSSTSINRVSDSPSVASSVNRYSQDSLASDAQPPPALPPRKANSRPNSSGSGMSSSSSRSSGPDLSDEVTNPPPLPLRTANPSKDPIIHGTPGVGNTPVVYNPSPNSQTPLPIKTKTRDSVDSTVTTILGDVNSSQDGRTSTRCIPPTPTPRPKKQPNLISSNFVEKTNGVSQSMNLVVTAGNTPPVPNRPKKPQPPTPTAASPPAHISDVTQKADAPPVPLRPKVRKSLKSFEQSGPGGTNL